MLGITWIRVNVFFIVLGVSLPNILACPIPNNLSRSIYYNIHEDVINYICFDHVKIVYGYHGVSYCINDQWTPDIINNCDENVNWRENFSLVHSNFNGSSSRRKRSPNVGKFEALKRYELVDKKINEGILETVIDSNTPKVVRVHPGSKAFLLCRIENLGTNSVLWYFGDKVLSIDTSIFIRDERYALSYDSETETWIMEIKKVRFRDEGEYTCMVSNKPNLRQKVSLQVIPAGTPLLPPKQSLKRRKKNIFRNNEIEELKQNLSLVWTEINRLKTDFQHHIQESDTPAFDLHNDEFQHGYDHHHNDSHHQEGDHQHEGDQHHGGDHQHGADHPHEGDHQHGADHHHEGDQHTDVGSGDGHDNTHANPDQHQGEHDHGYDHHGASDPYHSAEHDSYHHRYPHHDYHGDHNRNTDTRKQYSHSSKSDNDDDDDKKNDSGEDDDKDSSDEDKTPDKPQQDSKKTHHRGSDYRQPHNHHSYGHHQHHHHKKEDVIVAHCHLQPNVEYPGSEVNGHITIKQKSTGAGPLYFKINMKGFKIQEDGSGFIHGFHVHENGIQDQKCSTAGAHFNPSGVTHGAPYSIVRHVGDLGNIKVDKRGNLLDYLISDDTTKFFGPKSIVGRSIVVHALPDDLGLGGDEGSLSTGNAGARLACCTIEGKNIPPFMPTSPAIRFNG